MIAEVSETCNTQVTCNHFFFLFCVSLHPWKNVNVNVFKVESLKCEICNFKNPSKENRFQAQAMFLDDACTVISSVFVIAFSWSCVCHTGIYQVSFFVGVGEAT